jgi:hypothetical protein
VQKSPSKNAIEIKDIGGEVLKGKIKKSTNFHEKLKINKVIN